MLSAGDTVTIEFDVVVDDPVPVGVTDVSNEGVVTSNELPDVDSDDPDVDPGTDDPTVTTAHRSSRPDGRQGRQRDRSRGAGRHDQLHDHRDQSR